MGRLESARLKLMRADEHMRYFYNEFTWWRAQKSY